MNDDQASNLKILPARPASALDLDVQSFLLDCQARNLSPQTLHNYSPALANFLRFLGEKNITTIQSVTPDHLRVFFIDLQKTHNAGGVYWHYRVLKTFLRFMKDEGDITANPLERIRSPKMPQDILEPVALDVIGKLLDACSGSNKERDRAIMLCLLDSGLRASEFVALNNGDVDIATGRVVVRHGKGNKMRVVFLGAKARRALLRYAKQKTLQAAG